MIKPRNEQGCPRELCSLPVANREERISPNQAMLKFQYAIGPDNAPRDTVLYPMTG